jgi:hypothetical protein
MAAREREQVLPQTGTAGGSFADQPRNSLELGLSCDGKRRRPLRHSS